MKRIALVGATGNVGRKIIEIIEERNKFADMQITPIGSQRSQGKKLSILGRDTPVLNIDHVDFSGYDLVIFSAGSNVAEAYVHKVTQLGVPVIDCSSYHRMDPKVPLVIPTVNMADVARYTEKMVIATANCIASPMSTVLAPLQKLSQIQRVVMSTYQSVSGAGKNAMDELMQQTKSTYTTIPFERKVFPKDIAFNVIPMIDSVWANGNTGEESKISLEIKKVVDRNISVAVQAVRVPVFVGHSVSAFVEFDSYVSLEDAREVLDLSPYVTLIENPENCITPLESATENQVFVSRLRYDNSVDNGLVFWTASDNLRRGAALDVVEVAEELFQKYL